MVKHNSPDFDAPPPNEGVIVTEAVPDLLPITVRPYIEMATMRVPRIRREVSLHTHQCLVPLLLGMARSEWSERGAYCLSGVEVTAANIHNQDGTIMKLCEVPTSSES